MLADGYYWVRHQGPYEPLTTYIVYAESGLIYMPGIYNPVNEYFDERKIICPVKRPDN
jgi:hypothetical protein